MINWMMEHPWMTFFLAGSAIQGTVKIMIVLIAAFSKGRVLVCNHED